jgi:hypothetical protein
MKTKNSYMIRVISTYNAGQYPEAARPNVKSLVAAIECALMVGQNHHKAKSEDALGCFACYGENREEVRVDTRGNRCDDAKSAAALVIATLKGERRPWRVILTFAGTEVRLHLNWQPLY